MAAPAVRDLQALIGEIGQSIQPQNQLIDESMTANENAGLAQQQGLQAKQTQAFKGIEQSAQNKGMFFSGFSPDQQAQYTSTTYLPALAELQRTIAGTRASLLGKKADLQTDVFNKAYQTREGDISQKNAYDQEQERRAYEAEQARIEAERRAQEAEKDRQFTARQNAANRGASAAANKGPSQQEQFASALAAAAGGDGKVAPGDYNALKNQWVSAGYGDYKSFHDNFWKFANDQHWWDYR